MHMVVHLRFVGVLALVLLVIRPFEVASQTPPHLNIRLDGASVQLDWPATVGAWLLESTEDLSVPDGWTSRWYETTLSDGRLTLTLSIESPRRFFRLCTLSILFVNASNPRSGDGSFENPFKTVSSAATDARERFMASGRAQVIYVFSGSYHEAVHFDGTGLDGYQVTLLDSTTSIGLNGQLIGDEIWNEDAAKPKRRQRIRLRW